ncbi:MAG: ATP-dependent metallopeptidase FtsH/Yme1/Tma family protein [Candidatus Kapaibacterium sp.]|nr:MAG: ATP-dependent metallopeptidase FtsH/Yme1/Tma family protein [Candidatus Kapabacteria bacterium]
MYMLVSNGQQSEIGVSYTEYKQFLEAGKIESAVIKKSQLNDFVFHGTLREKISILKNNNQVEVQKFFTRLGVLDSDTEKAWAEKNITWRYEEGDSQWMSWVISLLPWAVLIGVYFFVMRRMQGGGGPGGTRGIFSFGRSRARLVNENAKKVTFDDVAGADEAKYELEEIIEFLRDPQKFERLGGKIPHGVLMLGPPGTGKTLLARAVAGEADVPFFSISGADFVEMFVGVGASRVRDLFEQAKRNAPCIIFIDEIDAVGRHRGAGLGGGHDEREQTLNQLLVEMDGFEQNSGIIVIAATNRADVLDPALLRPGRFDRQVVVDRPDVRGRAGILRVHSRNIPLAPDVDLEIIARGTPGLSGADLANLLNEAALYAARRSNEVVTMDDIESAKDKVLMGVERKSMVISDKEKEVTAYHEMGHALAGKLLPYSDPVHKVTIIPRGRALGITSYVPTEDAHTYSREYLETRLVTLLAGRAAELIVFNQLTTGAGNDIERTTMLARKMVCEWGMSEKVGPLNFANKDEEVFLAREVSHPRQHSEETSRMIDEEIRRIVTESMKKAENLLRENVDMLHKTSKILLERETLDAAELDMIMRGEELPPVAAKITSKEHPSSQNGVNASETPSA